jgi:hypothetical protein
MSTIDASSVLLVGSVPLPTSEEVFGVSARELGGLVAALPDGEPNDRRMWVNFQALRVFYMHPDLESVCRPQPVDGKEQWLPSGLADHWQFAVKPDAREVVFEDLRYAGAALGSYLTFRRLRDAGVIPPEVRFQVSLPMTYSGTGWFFSDPVSQERVMPAYQRALAREVDKIVQAIPAEELSFQWDVCFELLDIEGIFPVAPSGDPWERYVDSVRELSRAVPDEALLGYHLCYADLGHRHMKEPEDLALSVRMANAAVREGSRRTDFFHFAVPRDRNDDAYFVPLHDLETGDTRIFLGLVHHTDGLEGTLKRIATARNHLAGFGISTECGFGRRPAEQVAPLLAIHREAAAALS